MFASGLRPNALKRGKIADCLRFDSVPQGIGDVTGLPAFQAALRAHGYNDALMHKLCWDNWLSVLRRTWGG